jgi:hypothetical protein
MDSLGKFLKPLRLQFQTWQQQALNKPDAPLPK